MSELEETLNDGEDILEEADGNNAASNFELDNNNESFPSVRNDYPGNPSKKKQADNLINSRPSNLGTQPLPNLPYTEQSHQRPSVLMMTPSAAPTTVYRRQVGMPVLETIGSVTSSASVELSRAPAFTCSTPKDSGQSDFLFSIASDIEIDE